MNILIVYLLQLITQKVHEHKIFISDIEQKVIE